MEQFDWMVLFFAARAAANPDLDTEGGGAVSGWSATFRAAARQRASAASERALEHQPDQPKEDVGRLPGSVAESRTATTRVRAVERRAATHAEREREIRSQDPGEPGPGSG